MPMHRAGGSAALPRQSFLVLLCLAETPAHGYRLKKAVEAKSAGAVRIDVGSLYRVIARLLDDELIEETPAPVRDAGGDSRRKYYQLTAAGRAALLAEVNRMAEWVSAARALKRFKRPRHA